MSDHKKSKDATPTKSTADTKGVETKAETSPKTDAKTDAKAGSKAEAKSDAKTEGGPDATPKRQGMGEGQKPVSKAYKDNWNDIFGKKKKR